MNEPTKSFEGLEVWQKAHALTKDIYKFTECLPSDERFGLTSQFRRAAISVPSNIAEGYKRRTLPDKARFFNPAESSLAECHYYFILCQDLGYGEMEGWRKRVEQVGKLISMYSSKLRQH